MNKRLPIFDWMRSLAILIILFHHLPHYTFNFYDLNYFGISLNLEILNQLNRYFGLSLFVFVSGYLINVKKTFFPNRQAIELFIRRKIIRIFPLYYLAVICFCLVYHIYEPFKVLLHIFGLQLIVSLNAVQPIQTLWFIGLITVYYSIFLISKSSGLEKKFRIGIPVLLLILFLGLNGYFALTDFRLSLYYLVFFLGVYCAEQELPQQKIWQHFSYISLGCFTLISFCLFKYYDILIGSVSHFLVKYLLLNCLMVSFVITFYNICLWLAKNLKFTSLLQVFSYTSYCVYLFHRPIWHIMNKVLTNQLSIDNQYLLLLLLTLFGLPLIFGFSYILQTVYDKHFKHYLLPAVK